MVQLQSVPGVMELKWVLVCCNNPRITLTSSISMNSRSMKLQVRAVMQMLVREKPEQSTRSPLGLWDSNFFFWCSRFMKFSCWITYVTCVLSMDMLCININQKYRINHPKSNNLGSPSHVRNKRNLGNLINSEANR